MNTEEHSQTLKNTEKGKKMAHHISRETRQKIQNSTEDPWIVAKNLNVAPQTVKRWRARDNVETQPRGTPQRREQFVEDLQDLYELAVEKGNLAAAVRTKELMGKEEGFLNTTKIVTKFIDTSLEKMSDENLANLLELVHKKMEEEEAAGMGEPSPSLRATRSNPGITEKGLDCRSICDASP